MRRPPNCSAIAAARCNVASEAVLTVTPEGLVEQYNAAAEQMFGWSADEMLGQGLERLLPPDARGRHQSFLPLFAAEVDRATLKLKRKTERVIFPLVGDGVKDGKNVPHYGNFHTTAASPGESWVTSGEVIVANFRGEIGRAHV